MFMCVGGPSPKKPTYHFTPATGGDEAVADDGVAARRLYAHETQRSQVLQRGGQSVEGGASRMAGTERPGT